MLDQSALKEIVVSKFLRELITMVIVKLYYPKQMSLQYLIELDQWELQVVNPYVKISLNVDMYYLGGRTCVN